MTIAGLFLEQRTFLVQGIFSWASASIHECTSFYWILLFFINVLHDHLLHNQLLHTYMKFVLHFTKILLYFPAFSIIAWKLFHIFCYSSDFNKSLYWITSHLLKMQMLNSMNIVQTFRPVQYSFRPLDHMAHKYRQHMWVLKRNMTVAWICINT